MKITLWRLLPFGLVLGLGLLFWKGLSLNPQDLPSPFIDKPLPRFNLPLLGNDSHQLTTNVFRGKVTLLNVFASWCSACAEEQSFLVSLAEKGVPIYGINYKDNADEAVEWLKVFGNPYQKVGQDKTGHIALDLGVYGTPETFLIDAQGLVKYRYAGVLDETVWKREFLPIIANSSSQTK